MAHPTVKLPSKPSEATTQHVPVIVSSLGRCSCQLSQYPREHLALRQSSVSLRCGAAVAVPYAIGDFGRAKHIVGHHWDDDGHPVTLELGGEWDIAGMIKLLASVSEEKKAIWIDQLSIPQEDEEIRKQLQRVPDIYKTFEVVVLLPNAPCPCLADGFALYEAGDEYLTGADEHFHFR